MKNLVFYVKNLSEIMMTYPFANYALLEVLEDVTGYISNLVKSFMRWCRKCLQ